MIGRTNAGGTGGKPFAVIGVTYPAGATVTCTNGEKTLTSKDTTGQAMFVIPSAGTWTVKAVSGDKTASSAVEITAEGQVETVVLVYDLILFDGTDNTAVTGGWTTQSIEGSGSARIVNGAITVTGGTPAGGSAYIYQTLYITNNKINLSNLNALVSRINTVQTRAALFASASHVIAAGGWPNTLTSTDCVGYKILATSDAGGDARVDLSGVSGSYYVGLIVDGTGQIITPRIWLA